MATTRTGRVLIGLGALAGAFGVLKWLGRLPARDGEPASQAIPADPGTRLGQAAARRGAAHPGLSGLRLLADAHDAFAARVLLARAAERSLDLQYYIWHGDRTGTLLLEAVHDAARRGVRVRLLLDDNGIGGLDRVLAALDGHPDIEVRLFNPFRIRFPKAIGYLTDFGRLNRRMHNKSFTVDGAVTIVGGRNIGDEYFGAADGPLFADLDVLAIGPVVADVARDFDRYWDCASVWPAARILPRADGATRRKLARRASIVARDPGARQYVERLRALPLVQDLIDGRLDLEWAPVRMLSDDPAKGLGQAAPGTLLAGKLEQAIGAPTREFGIISGYFVPGDAAAQIAAMARSGVQVSILTNAYEGTDVGLVHAGYAPARAPLLAAGVRLFELCDGARQAPGRRERRRGTRIGIGSSLRGSGAGRLAALRSSASTLHAKTFTVDRARLFIGSFNFDPRSYELNTELGFVIDSPALASRVADTFEAELADNAYRLRLRDDGAIEWIERRDGTEVVHRHEPGMRAIDHFGIGIAAKLPIRWLL